MQYYSSWNIADWVPPKKSLTLIPTYLLVSQIFHSISILSASYISGSKPREVAMVQEVRVFYFFTFSSLVQKCHKIQRKSLRPFKNPPSIEIEKMRSFKISRMIYQSTRNQKNYLLWAQMKSMGSLHRSRPILALPSFVGGSFSERQCWYNIDIHIMRDILENFLL